MADRKSFLVRIDREVLDAVQRWANDDLRSLNGQIEYLLRHALREAGRAPKQQAAGNPEPVSEETEDP
ncbi:MAG: Arc family DNA-binding protein [Gemmatimonadaceae bacterium]|nr:Arc family DNA-binding protein [Gemmatimonadaceae bacterium]